MIEHVLPGDIEKRSFEIIAEELAAAGITLDPEKDPVIRRAIHTSADFDYAKTLVFSPDAVRTARKLIEEGADIVTDTNMALTGINKKGSQASEAASDATWQTRMWPAKRRKEALQGLLSACSMRQKT